MSDLINRYDVYAEIQKSFNKGAIDYADGQDLMDRVKQIPTAVVRCKECKHKTELTTTKWHPCVDMAVNDDWFCADGEREVQE